LGGSYGWYLPFPSDDYSLELRTETFEKVRKFAKRRIETFRKYSETYANYVKKL
jgi:hypothetical protein